LPQGHGKVVGDEVIVVWHYSNTVSCVYVIEWHCGCHCDQWCPTLGSTLILLW